MASDFDGQIVSILLSDGTVVIGRLETLSEDGFRVTDAEKRQGEEWLTTHRSQFVVPGEAARGIMGERLLSHLHPRVYEEYQRRGRDPA